VRKSGAFTALSKLAAADAERRGKSSTQCLEESRVEGESSNTFLKVCSMRLPNVYPKNVSMNFTGKLSDIRSPEPAKFWHSAG
jgi:hypothetical protein